MTPATRRGVGDATDATGVLARSQAQPGRPAIVDEPGDNALYLLIGAAIIAGGAASVAGERARC